MGDADAQGYVAMEAWAASAYEHWVGSEGLSLRGRDDAERLGDVVKFHWEAVAKDGKGLRSRAQLPRPRRGRPDRARLHVRRRLGGMGAAYSESRKGVSATTASTPAFAWTRASRRPAADARIGRSAGVSAGQGHAPAIRLEAKSLERTTPGHDLSARGNVAKVDNSGWSLYGAQRSQPVATGSKRDGAENATGRVRQRACKIPAHGDFSFRWTCPTANVRGGYGAWYGAFSLRSRPHPRPRGVLGAPAAEARNARWRRVSPSLGSGRVGPGRSLDRA
jgi:hypothetical protein